jgi:hypothetical protein
MKIHARVTIATLGKDGKLDYAPPGEIEVDEETATALIARGQATAITRARAPDARDGAATGQREASAAPARSR